jgi:hypothetical protein
MLITHEHPRRLASREAQQLRVAILREPGVEVEDSIIA